MAAINDDIDNILIHCGFSTNPLEILHPVDLSFEKINLDQSGDNTFVSYSPNPG